MPADVPDLFLISSDFFDFYDATVVNPLPPGTATGYGPYRERRGSGRMGTMGTIEIAEGAVPAPAVRWLFTGFVLDESTLELSRDGRLLPIERKPLEALLFMLQHSGEVVTKEELLAAVWPGRILSDTALAKCISRLREVLGDQNQTLIKTAHGYGYRFAGSPRTEVIAREAPPLLAELKAGDHPPLRPLWTLEERIGGGGMGDAWRVRHDKTGEVRVFKFARDPGRLTALKREITLYRLIKNTMEDEAPIVTLLDWNLEQPPYFIESRLADGGSLADWWNKIGGAAAVPMEERIELIARIADGLAAIHSIGVLHKDLKPSNVLLELGADGRPSRVLLGDLGSGGITDPARMEAMGITRLGFTRTIANLTGASGTPMYLSPEVLRGQPPTIQADLYALAVILYQIVIGDLAQPLAPGWERGVADPLLQEDIALAADGNSATRLADASEFARRLRARPERLLQREQELESLEAVDRAQRALERSRARRAGLTIAFIALVVGLIVSTVLYVRARDARDEAKAQTARATSISHFLAGDVFAAIDVGERPVKDMTVKELLDQAASKVDQRFDKSPAEAAEILSALAGGYDSLSQLGSAEKLYEEAIKRYDLVRGVGDEPQLEISSKLIVLKYSLGHLPAALPALEDLARSAGERLGTTYSAVVQLRLAIGRAEAILADWPRARLSLVALETDMRRSGEVPKDVQNTLDAFLGYTETRLAQYADAEMRLRRSFAYVLQVRGPEHMSTAMARLKLAELLIATGRYAEAEGQLTLAMPVAEKWVAQGTGSDQALVETLGLLRIHQQQPQEALELFDREYSTALDKDEPGPDEFVPMRYYQGLAYQQLGKLDEAEQKMRNAASIGTANFGLHNPDTENARIGLADVLQQQGRFDQAWRALNDPEPVATTLFQSPHPVLAELARVRGLVELGKGDRNQACRDLRSAAEMLGALVPPDDWRALKVQAALKSLVQKPEDPKSECP
ncbi:MAG: Non-specific serine/threonine protein kinase [Hydrocarboniphaga sp.]|uniref:protein kinase domain-containing protein n=1 Tax=Hydrocarboniphaga sp. TaxID=2033016 RepID=UPI00260B458C|nr:tetratricopeptide repeat protein [Hydrocarboniphaga sp.]MDB5967923.1 Non-specific serine/threonine protein kinase [Hydrocarboniphaga sp.]